MLLLLSSNSFASDISIHGFLQSNYSLNVSYPNPGGGDFKWAEERLQLKIEANKEPLRLFLKTDAFYEHIDEETDLELREAYIDYSSTNWDLRIGRQIITWGVGDLLFINDVFPKDYEAFFSGRPLEYLKKGVDAMKLGIYPRAVSLEVVVIPFFEPDRFPDTQRFWSYNPVQGIPKEDKKPVTNLKNTEIALRLYRDISGFDASIYFYRGFFRQPAIMPDNPLLPARLTLFYPELSAYGLSLQGRALDGVLSLEAGYYDSRQDRKGTDPIIPNSQTRFLIGYQRQPWEDFTASLQYYAEYMHEYSEYKKGLPSGIPKQKRLHQLMSIRLTQLLKNQTIRLSFFGFYGLTDHDYLFNPEIRYSFSDHIWAAIGGNIFGGGKEWSQFGSIDKDDNFYLQLRYELLLKKMGQWLRR
ncbi:MAG: DUF1302 family protein [Thermodesulfovibrionales bacterium]